MPRTRTIEQEVYSAKDLFPTEGTTEWSDIADQVIEKHWDINLDYNWWDDMQYILEHTSGWDKAPEGTTIGHSGNWEFDLDRGSFFRTSGFDIEDTKAFIKWCRKNRKDAFYQPEFKRLGQYIKSFGYDALWFNVKINRHSVDVDLDLEGPVRESSIDRYEQNRPGWEGAFEDVIYSYMEDIRICLLNEYEYRCSEEAIIESLRANEYEFDGEGNIV